MNRRMLAFPTLALVTLLALVALGWASAGLAAAPSVGATTERSGAVPLPLASPHPLPSINPNAPIAIGREQVVAHVQGLRFQVLRNDRLEAKLTTWSRLESVRGHEYAVSPFPAALPIWVVAVAGDILPQASKGKHYPWAIYVFDATSGEPIFVHAGITGTWPAYFDVMTLP
jgi:hypothetical protein